MPEFPEAPQRRSEPAKRDEIPQETPANTERLSDERISELRAEIDALRRENEELRLADTARRRDEEALRREKEEVGDILSALDTGQSLVEQDMTIVWVNQKARGFFPECEPIGGKCYRLFEGISEPCEICAARRTFETGEITRIEKYIPYRGRWFDIVAQPIKDVSGEVVRVLESFTDITERKRAEEAQRHQAEMFQRLIDTIPAMIAVFDPKFQQFRFNGAFREILGWTEEDAAGGDFMPMVFPDPACRAEAARFVQSLEPGWRDWKVTAKDGSIVESSWAKISLSDDTWIGIGIDIRERKRAEAAVRESEARLAAILENLPVGVWIVDSMGRVTAKNKAADLVWGGDAPLSSCPEEYVEYVAWDVETGDRMEADDYPLTRALRTGLPTTPVELRIRRFDGAEGFIMMSTALLRGPDGLLTGAVGINVDITEQKRAEETIATDLAALTRMHDMSGRLLDSEGIQPLLQGIMDTAVVVVGAEKGTLQLLEGDALRIVAFHDHQEPFLDFFASAEHQVSACGEAMNYKSRAIIPDVETAPLFAGTPSLEVLREAGVRAVQSTPLVSRSGALVGILTTHWSVPYVPDEHDLWRLDLLVRQAADLIEIARTEEALRQHTEELTRLHGDLKVANREANLYLDILTHDIGNTENVSNLYAELLIESLDSEAAGYAKKLQRSIQKSIEILGTVSTIRRIHRTTAELRPMDLDAAVRGVIEDFPTGIVRYSGAHHMVRADDLLSVIFDNLIGNAVKHGGPGVEITVRTEDTDGCVLVSVEDTGPGVPDEEKDAIFHRYEKKKRGVGEGLGLYLVQILVERYGGKVWVEDRVAGRPEEGAAFRFSLQKA